jgi:hypothetical protein
MACARYPRATSSTTWRTAQVHILSCAILQRYQAHKAPYVVMDMLTRLIYRADVPGLHAGDEPYWRGYIWININYLALRALHQLKGTTGKPHP